MATFHINSNDSQMESADHRREGLGATGVTRLDVVILLVEVFLRAGEGSVLDPSTFFVRAAVGFM